MDGQEKNEIYLKLKNILYDYSFENTVEWPCITCKWLNIEENN